MTFRWTSDTLSPNLSDIDKRALRAIHLMLEYWAAQAVSLMRANAPWTDRTGNARAGLAAEVFPDARGADLVLYHSVHYGIWLEVRWSGRYAIIGPTMNRIAPQVLEYVGRAVMQSTQTGGR